MNKHPIEQAVDSDLRLSYVAIQREARRARDLAEATGPSIVVSDDGVIEHLKPDRREIAGPNTPND